MALNQLWDEFKADAQAGYWFYSKDVDWSSFEQKKKWKRRQGSVQLGGISGLDELF